MRIETETHIYCSADEISGIRDDHSFVAAETLWTDPEPNQVGLINTSTDKTIANITPKAVIFMPQWFWEMSEVERKFALSRD